MDLKTTKLFYICFTRIPFMAIVLDLYHGRAAWYLTPPPHGVRIDDHNQVIASSFITDSFAGTMITGNNVEAFGEAEDIDLFLYSKGKGHIYLNDQIVA